METIKETAQKNVQITIVQPYVAISKTTILLSNSKEEIRTWKSILPSSVTTLTWEGR